MRVDRLLVNAKVQYWYKHILPHVIPCCAYYILCEPAPPSDLTAMVCDLEWANARRSAAKTYKIQ